jgi:hypothetical protein
LLATTTEPRTILNVTINNYAYNVSQSSWITCGTTKIAEGYYKEGRDSRDMVYPCQNNVIARNVGSVNSNGQIVYVNRDVSLTPPSCSDYSFSYGDSLLCYLFLILIVAKLANLIYTNYIRNRHR